MYHASSEINDGMLKLLHAICITVHQIHYIFSKVLVDAAQPEHGNMNGLLHL